jgi:two-component system sensor histidine kinase KdpD
MNLTNLEKPVLPKSAGKVMVFLSINQFNQRVIRSAKALADSIAADMVAVYIDTAKSFLLKEENMDQLVKNSLLAEKLSSETLTVSCINVTKEFLKLAQLHNVSHIVIGRPTRPSSIDFMYNSLANFVLQEINGISVHILSEEKTDNYPPLKKSALKKKWELTLPKNMQFSSFIPYFWGLSMVLMLSVILEPFKEIIGTLNVALLYLIPVLICAVSWGISSSLLASIAGLILFDLIYISPFLSFAFPGTNYIITFVIYMIIGLITGLLSTELKKKVSESQNRATKVATLYSLSQDITAVAEMEVILSSITQKISNSLECQALILLPLTDNILEVVSSTSTELILTEADLEAAQWVFENGIEAGKRSGNMSNINLILLPLKTAQGMHGVLVIKNNPIVKEFSFEQLSLLEAFTGLTSMAINRANLTEQAEKAKTLAESEKLRTALLNSLSHDLKTPLASIIGAVTTLIEGQEFFSSLARNDLLQSIHQGALRMNRFIGNLLETARLESGMLQLKKEWCDLEDIIGVAVSGLENIFKSNTLRIDIAPEMAMVYVDFILIEQVLVNLLDNAQKYSEPNSEISILAKEDEDFLFIAIENKGQYNENIDLNKIFDKFYRLKTPLQVSGTGLGLSICRGLVEAHSGKIWAERKNRDIIRICFTLPLA